MTPEPTTPPSADTQEPVAPEEATTTPQEEAGELDADRVLQDVQAFQKDARAALKQGRHALEAEAAQEKARLDALRAEFIPLLVLAEAIRPAINLREAQLAAIESGETTQALRNSITATGMIISESQSQFDRLSEGEQRTKIGEILRQAREKEADLRRALQVQQEKDAQDKIELQQAIDATKSDMDAPNDPKYKELRSEVGLLDIVRIKAVPKILTAIKTAQDWLKAGKKKGAPGKVLGEFWNTLTTIGFTAKSNLIIRNQKTGDFELDARFIDLSEKYKTVASLSFGADLIAAIKLANTVRKELLKAISEERKKQFEEFESQELQTGQGMKRVLLAPQRKGERERLLGTVILQAAADKGVAVEMGKVLLWRNSPDDRKTLEDIVQAHLAGKKSSLGRVVDIESE